jgi:hypothetical protein
VLVLRGISRESSANAPVAQLDRALPSEGKGCWFDPNRVQLMEGPENTKKPLSNQGFFRFSSTHLTVRGQPLFSAVYCKEVQPKEQRESEVNDTGRGTTKSSTWYAKLNGKTVALLPDKPASIELLSRMRLPGNSVSI